MARVEVDSCPVAEMGTGILALIGVEKGDGAEQYQRLFERIVGYRIFPDSEGKMNLGLKDMQGGLLLVPQFTLVADTSRGMRPGFSMAAKPDEAERIFSCLYNYASSQYPAVFKGIFAADMKIQLINDGPVTFYLRCPPGVNQA